MKNYVQGIDKYCVRAICENCGKRQRPTIIKGNLLRLVPCKKCECLTLMPLAVAELPPLEDCSFTVGDAAKMLNMHPNTIRTLTSRGKLPCTRVNFGCNRHDRRFKGEDLRMFLAGEDLKKRGKR